MYVGIDCWFWMSSMLCLIHVFFDVCMSCYVMLCLCVMFHVFLFRLCYHLSGVAASTSLVIVHTCMFLSASYPRSNSNV